MAKYILFDKLCEESSSAPFVKAAKELITKLDIKVSTENSFKKDLGLKIKAINEKAFLARSAYNLSFAAHDNLDIVCIDDSSYLSLNLTQKLLKDNEELSAEINKELDIELNLDTKVLHLNELIDAEKVSSVLKNSFDNFNAAIYNGPNASKLEKTLDLSLTCKLLNAIEAKVVNTTTCRDSDGYEIAEANKIISEKLAGTVLLDAFDNAADFIVINDVTTFSIFDVNQKDIATQMGREIDLPVLNIYQVLLLALGVTDKNRLGLDSHKVKVTLI